MDLPNVSRRFFLKAGAAATATLPGAVATVLPAPAAAASGEAAGMGLAAAAAAITSTTDIAQKTRRLVNLATGIAEYFDPARRRDFLFWMLPHSRTLPIEALPTSPAQLVDIKNNSNTSALASDVEGLARLVNIGINRLPNIFKNLTLADLSDIPALAAEINHRFTFQKGGPSATEIGPKEEKETILSHTDHTSLRTSKRAKTLHFGPISSGLFPKSDSHHSAFIDVDVLHGLDFWEDTNSKGKTTPSTEDITTQLQRLADSMRGFGANPEDSVTTFIEKTLQPAVNEALPQLVRALHRVNPDTAGAILERHDLREKPGFEFFNATFKKKLKLDRARQQKILKAKKAEQEKKIDAWLETLLQTNEQKQREFIKDARFFFISEDNGEFRFMVEGHAPKDAVKGSRNANKGSRINGPDLDDISTEFLLSPFHHLYGAGSSLSKKLFKAPRGPQEIPALEKFFDGLGGKKHWTIIEDKRDRFLITTRSPTAAEVVRHMCENLAGLPGEVFYARPKRRSRPEYPQLTPRPA